MGWDDRQPVHTATHRQGDGQGQRQGQAQGPITIGLSSANQASHPGLCFASPLQDICMQLSGFDFLNCLLLDKRFNQILRASVKIFKVRRNCCSVGRAVQCRGCGGYLALVGRQVGHFTFCRAPRFDAPLAIAFCWTVL